MATFPWGAARRRRLGDGFLAVFGAPLSNGSVDCANAMAAARQVMLELDSLVSASDALGSACVAHRGRLIQSRNAVALGSGLQTGADRSRTTNAAGAIIDAREAPRGAGAATSTPPPSDGPGPVPACNPASALPFWLDSCAIAIQVPRQIAWLPST